MGAVSLVAAGCRRHEGAAATADDTTAVARAVAAVRDQYHAHDAMAAGAWSWLGPDNTAWVLVDVQSTVRDVVEARLDLWASRENTGGAVQRVGRSDVMPAAAEFVGYAFEDLTGDGMPDFFGAVADSSGESFPVFIPGARGAMSDEIELTAHGYRFASGDENAPQVVAGPHGACALQLWVEAAPDSSPAGWRWFSISSRGVLGTPTTAAPTCS